MLDLLPCNATINKDVYCEQIDRLKIALVEKRSNLKKIIYHDNAPTHHAKKTSDKLKDAGWEIIVHHRILLTLPLRATTYSLPCKARLVIQSSKTKKM